MARLYGRRNIEEHGWWWIVFGYSGFKWSTWDHCRHWLSRFIAHGYQIWILHRHLCDRSSWQVTLLKKRMRRFRNLGRRPQKIWYQNSSITFTQSRKCISWVLRLVQALFEALILRSGLLRFIRILSLKLLMLISVEHRVPNNLQRICRMNL